MKVLVLGGDGFCGWPASLHLSARGDDVVIVDNFSRRRIDEELGVQSLTPIRSMVERRAAWRELSGRDIDVVELDIAQDYHGLLELLETEDVLVVPGSGFNVPQSRHFRVTLLPEAGAIREVFARIDRVLGRHAARAARHVA